MGSKRPDPDAARQVAFAWTDAKDLLRATDTRGELVYEAPEVSRVVRARVPRVPRVRVAPAVQPRSLGLPFGVRRAEGRFTCWSCAGEVGEAELVRAGPGYVRCPGCGAKLPFAD